MNKLLQRYRYSTILLREFVVTDFKLRYQGSFLGYLWSLLRPLGIFLILYIVFVRFLRFGESVPHFPIYLLLGIVVWQYFADVTNGGVGAIASRGDLLRKINFPKYVLVLAGSFSALINLAINMLVVFFFMLFNDVSFHWHAFAAAAVIVELFLFSLALGFFLAALFVRLRDINHVWEVIMQGLFYATPIIYPLTLIPLAAQKLLLLSPLAQIIQDIRYLLVTPETPTIGSVYGTEWVRLIPFSIVLFITVCAVWYFRRASPHFAEEI